MSEYAYYFENLSTVLQDDFTILNKNSDNHLENQTARNMLEKIKVHINLEMDSCKHICSNMDRQNFVNSVAYLSSQITDIFPNSKIENKKKLRLLEVRTRK